MTRLESETKLQSAAGQTPRSSGLQGGYFPIFPLAPLPRTWESRWLPRQIPMYFRPSGVNQMRAI